MIDRDTIDRIFATADIAEVVGDFVKLKRAGANYRGHSPFTNEKTPSFFVSPAKGIYKCFSSGKGGNVVTFLMEHEKISYPEALKYLAKKYNIEIQEKEPSADEIKERNERESLLATVEFAAKQFEEWLWKREEGRAVGLSYFKERGFREHTIKKFQLGYSPEQRDAFTKLAIDKGYKKDYLVKTGLTIDKGQYHFDRFAGRVLFPIQALSGQIIGFGGRILKKDDKMAKYLNSPESDIYHKSHVLYGLFFAKKAILTNDKCYLVEGYTDVISMHQSGIENVVSSSGTALTKEQIRLIKRFTKNITVLYDGDEAGIKASLRGIDLILEEGLNVKVMLLPDGEDPDSYARSHSSSEFTEFIEKNETDFIRFKTKLLINDAKGDPVKRATLITDIVRSISAIPDGIMRSVYLRECSNLLDIGEEVLLAETQKVRRNKIIEQSKRLGRNAYTPEPEQPKTEKQKPAAEIKLEETNQHEKDVLQLLFLHGNKYVQNEADEEVRICEYVISELDDTAEFRHPVCKKIYGAILDKFQEFGNIDEKHFSQHEDPEITAFIADLLATDYQLSKIWNKDDEIRVDESDTTLGAKIPKIINAFKNKWVQWMIQQTMQDLEKAQKNKNDDDMQHLQQQYMILASVLREISKDLGDRVVLK